MSYFRNAQGQITKRDPLVLALAITQAVLAGAVAVLAFVVGAR